MQKRRIPNHTLALGAALLFCTVSFAQTPSPSDKGPADLSGMWSPEGGPLGARFNAEDAPLQPWAMELYRANREGIPDPNNQGLNGMDPEMYCLPLGVPRIYTSTSVIEIIQVPNRVYMIFQSSQNPLPRHIYMDEQGHPEGYPNTFMGHSFGRWDGDTLVIDTIALDEVTWLDHLGTPHSDALHVVERLRRVAKDTINVDLRFEDPKAFTRPWNGRKVLKLRPDWQMMPGLICEDRFKTEFSRKSLRDKPYWMDGGK